nr:MAG: polyprotein [Picornavirales sp.]
MSFRYTPCHCRPHKPPYMTTTPKRHRTQALLVFVVGVLVTLFASAMGSANRGPSPTPFGFTQCVPNHHRIVYTNTEITRDRPSKFSYHFTPRVTASAFPDFVNTTNSTTSHTETNVTSNVYLIDGVFSVYPPDDFHDEFILDDDLAPSGLVSEHNSLPDMDFWIVIIFQASTISLGITIYVYRFCLDQTSVDNMIADLLRRYDPTYDPSRVYTHSENEQFLREAAAVHNVYVPQSASGEGGLYDLLGLEASEGRDWAEDISLLILQMMSSKDSMSLMWAFASFIKVRSVRHGPGSSSCPNFLWLATYLKSAEVDALFKSLFSKVDPPPPPPFPASDNDGWGAQIGVGDFIGAAKDASQIFKGERGTRFMQAFVLVVSVLSFAGTGTFEIAKVEVLKKAWTDSMTIFENLDILTGCISAVKWVTTSGYQAYSTGSLEPFFCSETTLSKWSKQVDDALAKRPHLTTLSTYSTFTPGGKDSNLNDFRANLVTLLAESDSIRRSMTIAQNKFGIKTVDGYIRSLRGLLTDVETRIRSATTRPSPFAVVVYGGSGVRKTAIVDILLLAMYNVLDISDNDRKNCVYYRNPTDQYWSGAQNNTCRAVVLDDVAFENTQKIQGMSPSLIEILSLINNMPLCANMADVDDKGSIYPAPSLVVATTNVFDLSLPEYYKVPYAAARRFPFTIEVICKSKFATPETADGDPSKRVLDPVHQTSDNLFSDYWDFKITRVVGLSPNNLILRSTVLDTTTSESDVRAIDQLTSFFCAKLVAHVESQKNYMSTKEALDKISLCKKCFVQEAMCRCVPIIPDARLHPCEPTPDLASGILGEEFYNMDPGAEPYDAKLHSVGVTPTAIGVGSANEDYEIDEVPIGVPVDRGDTAFGRPHDFSDIDTEGGGVYGAQSYEAIGFFATTLFYCAGVICVATWLYRRACRWYHSAVCFINVQLILCKLYYAKYSADVVLTGANYIGTELLASTGLISAATYFRSIGRRLDDSRPAQVKALYFAVTAGALYTLYLCYKAAITPKHVEQGLTDAFPNIASRPPNPWIKTDTPAAVSAVSQTSRGDEGATSIINRVHRNMLRLTVLSEGLSYSMYALGVSGEHVVTNKHFFVRPDGTLRTSEVGGREVYNMNVVSYGAAGQESPVRVHIPVDHVAFADDGGDVAAFILPSRKFKSLTGQRNSVFAREPVAAAAGYYYTALKEHIATTFRVAPTPNVPAFVTRAPTSYIVKPSRPTLNGECGMPLFARGAYEIPVLVGFHAAANSSGSLSTIITHVAVLSLISKLPKTHSVITQAEADYAQFDIGELQDQEFSREDGGPWKGQIAVVVGDVHPKAIFNHLDHDDDIAGPYHVVGGLYLPGVNSKGQPNRYPSKEPNIVEKEPLLAPYFRGLGFESEHTAPVTSGYRPQRSFMNRVRKNYTGDTALIKRAFESLANDVVERLGDKAMNTCGKLCDVANANGIPDTAVPGVNFSKSSGAHKCVPKRDLCHKLNDDPKDPRLMPNDDIWHEVDMFEEGYEKENKTTGVLWHATWKVELVSFAKASAAKTRAIFFAPFSFLLLVRRYFGTICALIQSNNFDFETAWGINATGPDWTKAHDYITEFGTDVLAGDYVAYDVSAYTQQIIMLCFSVLIFWNMKFSGSFTERDRKMMWGIAADSCSFYVNFFGTLLIICGLLPSGHPLTTVLNGMIGSVYMRVAWVDTAILLGHAQDTPAGVDWCLKIFPIRTRLLTYGDDHIMGVMEGFRWFNASLVQMALAKYHVGYTGTQKGEPIPETLTHISNETFLKRKFLVIYDQEVRAPLEIKSLVRSALKILNYEGTSLYDHASSVLPNIHAGAAQHDRATFDRFDSVCRLAASELSLNCDGLLLTYDEYYDRCYEV